MLRERVTRAAGGSDAGSLGETGEGWVGAVLAVDEELWFGLQGDVGPFCSQSMANGTFENSRLL